MRNSINALNETEPKFNLHKFQKGTNNKPLISLLAKVSFQTAIPQNTCPADIYLFKFNDEIPEQ